MKIEKLSDTQIKLTLTNADLKERNIKLEELIKPSEKTQGLFRDIMEQAFTECGIHLEDAPLMVEATPVALDGLMIIVTKLAENESVKDKVSLIAQNKDTRRYKRKSISHYTADNDSNETLILFSFENLDSVSLSSSRIHTVFSGQSTLYKYNEKYFLLLQLSSEYDNTIVENITLILGEYGTKHISTPLSKYFLVEHGEIIVKANAVEIMASI